MRNWCIALACLIGIVAVGAPFMVGFLDNNQVDRKLQDIPYYREIKNQFIIQYKNVFKFIVPESSKNTGCPYSKFMQKYAIPDDDTHRHLLENNGATDSEQSLKTFNCQLNPAQVLPSQSSCQYGMVDDITRSEILPLVKQITQTVFFRYFKVNLYCNCPLWSDGMCVLEACAVGECPDHEIPPAWKQKEQQVKAQCETCEQMKHMAEISVNGDSVTRASLLDLPTWQGFNNPWMYDNDDHTLNYDYVNLQANPEKYTGYKGEHASRIWTAMYGQSCFGNDPHSCPETAIFYRLLSGLHGSINIHVAQDYLIDETTGTWGPNLQMFKWTLGLDKFKDRVENMYFAYLFVLSAVNRAAPVLRGLEYSTGLGNDHETKEIVERLLNSPQLSSSCPVPFDEGRLWKGEDAQALKMQLQSGFKNITEIMNCVGCDKCMLWGKVQILGLATALKIMFSSEDCTASAANQQQTQPFQPLVLERNELIALFNTLDRFASGIDTYIDMSAQLSSEEGIERSLKRDDFVPFHPPEQRHEAGRDGTGRDDIGKDGTREGDQGRVEQQSNSGGQQKVS